MIEAPAAPSVQPAPSKAPALPNAPKVEIPADSIGQGAEPPAPVKPGSARESVIKSLREKVKPDSQAPEPAKSNEPKEKPEPVKELEEIEEAQPAAGDVAPAAAAKAAEDPKKGKVSPWKLVEEYKARLAKVEAERLEIEKRAIPESKWKEKESELEAKTSRLNELEEEIKYYNYSKSKEFKEQYQEPYQRAWDQAMGELGEITISVPGGGDRPMEPKDLLRLVNMPLQEAKAESIELFGDLSPEVMAHRKAIIDLNNKQQAALENARKAGTQRETLAAEEHKRKFGEVTNEIKQVYSSANEEIKADPKYGKFFNPVEGDQEINQRLAKGFALADRAFNENPLNAKTAEERNAIVKRHAAVRNRCAAFGRLVYENGVKESKIAELEKALKDFKASDPELSGTKPAVAPAKKGSTMDSVLADLRKRAKQQQ